MSWPLGSLKDIAEVISGYAFKSTWFDEGVDKVIRIGDLQEGKVNLQKSKTFDSSVHTVREQFRVRSGDILMALSGATVGKIAVADGKCAGAYLNQRVAIIRAKQPESASYIKYIFSGNYLDTLLLNAGGAAQPNLSPKDLLNMQIPLPPLNEQKRIAAILDKADAIRQKRKQAIDLAEDFLRSVFLDMFGDPVTNPKGWDVRPLGEVLRIRRGASPRPIKDYLGGNVPWIKISDGSKGDQIYLHETKEFVTEAGAQKSVYLDEGALIFANCGVSLGFARILKKPGCIHDGWLAFDNIDNDFNKIFLLKWLNQLTKHFRRIAPDGTQPNLNTAIMKEQELICPPIELQLNFESVVHRTDTLLGKLKQSYEYDNEFFNSLSQKAFSGQL
ncbi:restriction endonuclease subunit S [Vibrio cholerae]|nr:restriction endonuclease subunit S [Vibrio cholerae]